MLRLAALLHDIGKPATKAVGPDGRVSFHHHEVVGARLTRQRLKALRYPKDVIADVAELVLLHLRFYGYGRGEWTDSAVRRYVTDAGPLLPRLHKLTRSDCTTRNRRKAAQLAADYDALEARIARIAAEEDLARVRPDLDGNAIMELLGLPPGPLVGEAWRHLKELRLERGPLEHDEAVAELMKLGQRARPALDHRGRGSSGRPGRTRSAVPGGQDGVADRRPRPWPPADCPSAGRTSAPMNRPSDERQVEGGVVDAEDPTADSRRRSPAGGRCL